MIVERLNSAQREMLWQLAQRYAWHLHPDVRRPLQPLDQVTSVRIPSNALSKTGCRGCPARQWLKPLVFGG